MGAFRQIFRLAQVLDHAKAQRRGKVVLGADFVRQLREEL
jgi:hypothetical protein